MIAAGLCMIGGCFALNNGAVVDSYWPSARAFFSPELDVESLKVVSFLTYGGDSENDRALLAGSFTCGPNYASWKAAAGIIRPIDIQQGRINIICDDKEGYCVYGDYVNNRLKLIQNPSSNGIYAEMQVAAGKADIKSTGVSGSLADFYSFDNDVPREFVVRSKITKAFNIFWYANARLGTRWCVRAMQSPTGCFAIYADVDESLTEI
jgi:hypothetical protein